MMKMTATVQANFDYASEADAVDKIRTAYGVTSIVTAHVRGVAVLRWAARRHKSFRAAIWLETDEDRCGLLPFVFEPGFASATTSSGRWTCRCSSSFATARYRRSRRPARSGASSPRASRARRDAARLGASPVDAVPRGAPEALHRAARRRRGPAAAWRAALGALWRGLLDDPDARAAAWELVAEPFVRGARGAAARGAAGGAAGPLRRPAPAGSGAGADADLATRAWRACRRRGRRPLLDAAVGLRRRRAGRRRTTCSTTRRGEGQSREAGRALGAAALELRCRPDLNRGMRVLQTLCLTTWPRHRGRAAGSDTRASRSRALVAGDRGSGGAVGAPTRR